MFTRRLEGTHHIKLYICIAIYLLALCINFVDAIAVGTSRPVRDHDYYFEEYNVKVVESPNVETTFPTRAIPDPDQTNTDLSYWVHDVLPFEKDKNAPGYIIYPEHGIVVPLLTPNQQDQQLIDNGQLFDHYGYLEQGALHYFGKDPSAGVGNMVVAAHSSFKIDSPGTYKTVFQALPISQPGDKIFVYEKNAGGLYDFYEYTINASFETNKYDVSILRQDVDVPTLTTYGCYTIGSNKDRWVNVATLSNMVANLGNLNTTQKLLTKNTVTEHAAAPETPATTETNSNKSTAATTSKPSLAEQLAQSNISKSPIEPVVLKPQEHAAPADLATDVLPTAVVPKVTETPVETKPVTSSDDVPLTIRIKYQGLVKQTARSLFEKSLRSNLGINGVIQLIQKLKKDLPSKDFRMHILSLLEEELAAYQ